MPLGDYLLGLVFLFAVLSAALGSATVVVRRRTGHLSGASRGVAVGTVTLAALIGIHLVPLALGLLSRGAVLVAAAACFAAALLVPRRESDRPATAPRATADPLPSRALAALAATAVVAHALVHGIDRARTPLSAFDALTFHLPGVARWLQSGSVWQADQFLPDYAFGNYPHNGNLLQLAAVLPWDNDAFVRFVNYPLLGLACLSIYALARELGAPGATAVTSAAVFASVPVAALPALEEGQADTLLLAGFGAGLLFVVRHARHGGNGELVLAGLGLGIAFGTKWYGPPSVIAILALWAVGLALARRPPRLIARQGLVLAAVVAAAGGFWLVRNLVESGNPVFPLRVAPLGVTLFDAPRDTVRERLGFTIAGYLDQPDVLRRHVAPGLHDALQLPGLVLLAAALAALAVALARRRDRLPRDRLALAVAVAALLLAAVYALTPNSALGYEDRPIFIGAAARYLLPALIPAAAAMAWVIGRAGRARPLLELGLLAAALDGLDRAFDPEIGSLLLAVAGLGASGAAWLFLAPRLRGGSRPMVARAAAVTFAVALTVAAVAGGHRVQRELNDGRYRDADAALAWIEDNAGSGHRIGLAGRWSDRGPAPTLPAFGPRFGNEVEYVGPLVREMLRTYGREEDFTAALARGRFDLLLVGRGGPPPREAREERWARAAGFAPVARSARLTLYRAPTR